MMGTPNRAALTLQQLYDDASLRGDLTDDEAAATFACAADALKSWDADPALADAALWESRLRDLRGFIRALGKFAALRTYAPEGDQLAAVQQVGRCAAVLGWGLDAEAFFYAQHGLDGPAMIKVLRTILTVTDDPAPQTDTVAAGKLQTDRLDRARLAGHSELRIVRPVEPDAPPDPPSSGWPLGRPGDRDDYSDL